jgi:hypothetical protein
MSHAFKFVRAGGFDQVQILTGADLMALPELDQKLWVALACPITGIELDERTLALIDTDGDKRIHAPELLAAVKWACAMVKDPDVLVPGSDALKLADIDDEEDEGKLLLRTAKSILKALGKADQTTLSVAEASKAAEAFDKEPFNGDGVLVEASIDDAALLATFKDILSTTSAPDKDASGKDGANEKTIEAFFADVAASTAWWKDGETAERRPLGAATADAFAALEAVRSKIDDYFARGKIAAYDARALAAINGEEKQYLEIAAKDLDVTASEVKKLPLAQVKAGASLPLARGINPAYAAAMASFERLVVEPLLGAGRDAITEADFRIIEGKLAAHRAWFAEKKGARLEKLGPTRIIELAAGDHAQKLAELVAKDVEREAEAKALDAVEKLVRLHRDLMQLVNNFVTFRDFYSRRAPAIFQVGRLYIDERTADLCVRVADAAKHASLAPLSNAYLLYCDLKNAKGETMQIAAAMTAGDTDNLMVGRNGLFYDRKGHDWSATVTKIVDNPISVRQAFWSPYKKVLRMIEERIAKRAADEEKAQDDALAAGVTHAAASTGGTAPTPPPAPRGFDVGTVAAMGVAVGGITAALGALLQAFFGLGVWMPLGIIGLVLCISGPSMAVAWLKLRKRNLGPILDANGWAVNAQAVINVPLGASLTQVAVLPAGARRDLSDPFGERRTPWGLWTFIVVLVLSIAGYILGYLDGMLPPEARSTRTMAREAPESATEVEGAAPGEAPTP